MSIQLRGIFGPLVTPFSDPLGDVDLAGFTANIEAHLAAGLSGVVVAGSTGEAALLDESERQRLIEAARKVVPSDRLLLAGTGAESTRASIRLANAAAAAGADAVLVVAPHYYSTAMTGDALTMHYTRIADESPVPVILYNIPKYMHYALAPSLVGRLATHQNIIGIKDSSGDHALFSTYLNVQSPTFAVLTGSAQLLRQAIAAGADGGILAVGLFAPTLSLEVVNATKKGDNAAAESAQYRLGLLGSQIVGELGVPGVKAALDAGGLRGGSPRLPLLALTGEPLARVRDLVARVGVGAE